MDGIGLDWMDGSPGGRGYRAPYGANNINNYDNVLYGLKSPWQMYTGFYAPTQLHPVLQTTIATIDIRHTSATINQCNKER